VKQKKRKENAKKEEKRWKKSDGFERKDQGIENEIERRGSGGVLDGMKWNEFCSSRIHRETLS
jgi:hypothetical protein